MRYLTLNNLEERLPPVPLLLQVLFPVYTIANLINFLAPLPLFFEGALVFSVLYTLITLIHLRDSLKFIDIALLTLLVALLFYAKHIHQDHVSLVMGLANALIAYSIGFLFLRRSWDRMTFRLQYFAIIAILVYGLLTERKILPLPAFERTVLPRYQALSLFVGAAHIYIADFLNRRFRPRFWPTMIFGFVAFTARTVSGAIISVLQLGVITLVNIQYISLFFIGPLHIWIKRHKAVVIIILLLLVFAIILIFPYLYLGPRIATIHTRNISRTYFVDAFLSEMTPKKALTGFTPSFFDRRGLPNTYLWMIASFGVFSLLFFAAMLTSLRTFFERSWLLLGIFLIMGVYFAGERLFPFNYVDTLFIPLLILGIHKESLYFPFPKEALAPDQFPIE